MEEEVKQLIKNHNIFKDEKNAVWIMYNSENRDPYFSKFVTDKTIVTSIAVLSNEKNFLIAHELDCSNIKDFNGEVLVYSGENFLIENVCEILKKLGYPEKIFLNYSDKLDIQTDVLGYGAFRFLHDNISKYYCSKNISPPDFQSADEIIYSLMDVKSDEDIKYLQIAAQRALEILNAAFKRIRIGMTEKQIANIVHQIFQNKPQYFKIHGIIKEEFSWERDFCPVVLVGPNLKKGGHSCAGDEKLKYGQTVYFDFGVKIFLTDGRKYSSDIQRMGYALRPGEFKIPESVQNVFETLVEAIELGIKNLKPSKKGYEIDEVVRNHITAKGYPNYNHATGHPVGELAHSPGTSISPKGYKRSSLFLQENGVYTIEPRIQIDNGGSIEEMVRVTKNGGATLCPPQKKLYLIK